MDQINLDAYQREMNCIYDDEYYSVRDNGAVLRHPRTGKRPRPTDNQWTFGKPDSKNGYMHISSARIHRIVATAFHGDSPTPERIADHIDTNRQNNRPENLRWLTRLENTLLNPITRARIEFICGSIDAFLDDPSILRHPNLERNLEWMRTVTPEEARNCKLRLSILANSSKSNRTPNNAEVRSEAFAKRIYKPLQKWEVGLGGEPGLEMALTQWCAQYMWRCASHFPCCPENPGMNPIEDYFQRITKGAVLAYSDDCELERRFIVHNAAILKEGVSIVVMCQRENDRWAIVGIEFDEKSKHFIHFILGLCATMGEADQEFHAQNEQTNFWSKGYANSYKIN